MSVLDRAPFSWLRERDVDLLLCAELHADGELTRLFARRLGVVDGRFAGAWVSHAEIEGESDLVVSWSTEAGQALVLLENKIGAAFQPEQAARYRQRARRWAVEEGVTIVSTMLFAPAGYADAVASGFDVGVTYEEAADVARLSADKRSRFFAEALTAGVAAFRAGWVSVPDEQVSAVWKAIWDAASERFPKLRMARPADKPGQSTWVYFREAEGLLIGGRRCADVVYKAEAGRADLQFPSTTVADLTAATDGLLLPNMIVARAQKSASIRIEVPKLDFHQPPDRQRAFIDAGLYACEDLRLLLAEHRASILATLGERRS